LCCTSGCDETWIDGGNDIRRLPKYCHPERSEGSILIRIDPSLRSG
jgi:hypothetical protein